MEYTEEELNYFRMCRIVSTIVPEALQIIFKHEWDALYTATHGQWDDTPFSYDTFYNMEPRRTRTLKYRELRLMSSGDRKNWDTVCLFYAILYSDSVGRRISSVVKKGVDEIRQIRNEWAHNATGKISEAEFKLSIQKLKVSLLSLNLDIARLEGIEKSRIFSSFNRLENIQNAQPESFCVLPPHPSHDIIYRKEVDSIYQAMQKLSSENKGETSVVYLTGNPGSGKSVIARQLGKMSFDDDFAETSKFVMTLDASSLDTLLNSYVMFAKKLTCYPGSITSITTAKDISKEVQILQLKALVSEKVAKYSKWWIIADNVTDLNFFSKYWQRVGEKISGEGQIIVTTQDSQSIDVSSHCVYHFSLSSGLTEEDAIKLLSDVSGYRDAENAAMLKVSKVLDFQPLALCCLAIYMRSVRSINEHYTFLECLKDLEIGRERMMDIVYERNSLAYPKSMTTATNMALSREITDEIMLHAFRFISVIGSDPIPLNYVVEYVAKHLPDVDSNEIPARICSSSLVRVQQPSTIFIHQVVHHCLQRNPHFTEGIAPSEIIARGPKAHRAYLTALKSGKVKNCRVPIVVVGQSRSGKTSVLKSLHGEKFNPDEDSTKGVELQRSLSKAQDGYWEKTETDEHAVYNRCAARAMTPQLLTADSMGSDDNDYSALKVNNVVSDSLETHQVEDKTLQLNVNPKMVHEDNTQENYENHTGALQPRQLPEQVARYAENILKNPDFAKRMENELFLHTMDFAGQPVYSVTHPVFLPPKGIFLLVHNLENDLHAKATPMVKDGAAERIIDDHCPMTNMDHLEFWLSLVAANSTLEGGSPVFVVSTHADKPFQLDVKQTARQILHTLKREDFVPGNHVVRGIYPVDNTLSGSGGPDDPGVQRLKVDLSNEASSLPQLNEDIPIRWLLFEKRLMSLVKEEKKKYILHEEAEKIAIECEVDVESDELGTLLDYLHDLKVIIYFPETDMIIIDTQWLLDMFSKVITVQPIECHHKGFESDWRKLEENGMINVNFLEHLWCDLLDDNASLQSLVDIMEKFSLICKWRQLDGGTSFLVPAMLMNTSADNANQLIADNLAFPLVIRFDSSHLPFAIFTRLLVLVEKMCNSKWPGASQPHLSKNFARFYIADGKCSSSLVFTSDVQTITVALFNEKTRGNRDCFFVKLSTWLTEFLERTLKNMMESFPWMKRLEFAFGIRCPICNDATPCKKHAQRACPRDSCLHFVSKQELLSTTQMRCNRSPTKQDNVIPDSSFSHWFHRKDDNAAKVKETQEQFQVLSLASSSTEDGDVCKEVIAAANQNSKIISSDEVTRTAKRIADVFNLDKHSTTTPPEETTHKCRTNCRWLVAKGGEVFVEALRKELPSGMTGPLKFGYGVKVCDMDSAAKLQFSEALSGKKMEWKAFAKEKVGLSHYRIEYLHERLENPVLAILNEDCRDWSVEELYNAVADIGADAVADDFL